MADRFFVDGLVDNDFNGTDNWSSLSGGSGGASVPGLGDNAILDGNSPNACDVNANSVCQDLDTSAWTGTLDFNIGSNYLRTYGNVTLSANTTLTQTGGGGYIHLFKDNSGGIVTFNGCTWGCGFRYGDQQSGGTANTWTFQDDVTMTGDHMHFIPLPVQSYNQILNRANDAVITYNPSGTGEIRFQDGTSPGFAQGNALFKITATVNMRFINTADNWYCALKFEVATGGAVTLFGASSGTICRIGGGFELRVTGSGTIVGDPILTPIPQFYHTGDSSIDTFVAFNDDFHYRMYFRESSSTQYWQDESTGITHLDFYKLYKDGSKLLYSNNGKLHVLTAESISNDNTWYFRGDSGMLIDTLINVWTSADTMILNWGLTTGDAARYEITTRIKNFPTTGTAYGLCNWNGEDATLKTRFLIWHKARVQITRCNFNKIDSLSEGQPLVVWEDSVLTNTTGVTNEMNNLSVWRDDGTVATLHSYYKNEIYDPVTVSGTVELSATPQINARVHVITGQTDPEGVEWFMLRHVLVTNASGEWTCAVPRDSTVYVSARYDSGATKYNSLSKPFIDAS